MILPLTGNNDHLGQPIRELIQYRVAHFPKDSRFEYKVCFEDDQLQAKQSLLAAQRLVGWENVDVLLTYFSGPGSVVSYYATQKKVPHLMWNFNLSSSDGVYNFTHLSLPANAARCWTDYAQKLGYKKVAFLVHRNPGALAVQKALRDYKPNAKLEWADETFFNPGERDFRIILWRIREKTQNYCISMPLTRRCR